MPVIALNPVLGPKATVVGGPGGSGDVVGPASSVDSRFVSFDGTTGKLIKDSGESSSSFAVAAHNHDASYSAIGHNHDLSYAALSHTHAAADINAGTIATARLGSSTADLTTFLRGDSTWAIPPGGGGGLTETIAYKTGDQLNIGTAYADVTGTGLSVSANKAYAFEFVLLCDSDATTTGIDVSCNGPASPTAIVYEQVYWTSATARTERGATVYDANTASTASNGTATKIFRVRGIIRNGANAGTLIARAKREAVGSGPNIRTGSYGRLTALD